MLISNNSFKEYLHKEFASHILSKNLKNYLINLLCFYINAERLFEKSAAESKSYEKTLVEWYKISEKSNKQEKLHIFKKIGDFSLYLSGFFRESLKKKLVHLSYYKEMGQTAYHYVGQSYPTRLNVFKELSIEFSNISEILFSLQKKSSLKNQEKYFLNWPEDFLSEEFKYSQNSH